ncbi:hypothetical protein KVT40_005910 [Elsinoe batatas]|uniref:DNA damage-responsive protein 48 n=1 Tax=Elsinoe batatas TaxID=2601811 RepID=A0A8K0L3W0_9PEZI|nr:hypothetical protein KVT40_005910 [Elsinoe batatas]
MDFVKNLAGGSNNQEGQQQQSTGSTEQKQEGGGFLGGIGDKLNSAGVDFVQEKVLGQGPQDDRSAIEQAKDEQISDYLRGQYKSATGSDIPIKDKETRLG